MCCVDVEVFGPMCYRPVVKFPAGDHVLVIRQKEEEKKVSNINWFVVNVMLMCCGR